MSVIILKDLVCGYINVSNQAFPHILPGAARKQGLRGKRLKGNRDLASPTQALQAMILAQNSVPQAP
jgi:hypothetical protein